MKAKSKLQTHENKSKDKQSNEMEQIRNYNKMLTELLYQKIGLTDETMCTINKHYRTLSLGFDKFTDLMVIYLAMFREVTKDVIGLKTMYHIYDELCVYASMIETIRQFSNSVNRVPMNRTDHSDNLVTSDKTMFGNISPEEEQKLIDEMTMKMMSQFDMNEFTKMMEQLQPLSKPSSSKSSNPNTKKKKSK
jgi:hypothetical protein